MEGKSEARPRDALVAAGIPRGKAELAKQVATGVCPAVATRGGTKRTNISDILVRVGE